MSLSSNPYQQWRSIHSTMSRQAETMNVNEPFRFIVNSGPSIVFHWDGCNFVSWTNEQGHPRCTTYLPSAVRQYLDDEKWIPLSQINN